MDAGDDEPVTNGEARERRAVVAASSVGGRLKRRLRPAMMIVALAFVGVAAWDLARRWGESEVTLRIAPAALSLLPLLAGSLVQGFAWIRLIERMAGRRVPTGPALALYMDSQLARYTPGKVGLPVVRMAGAPRLGVPAATVGSSVLVEMASWTAVGGAAGFGMLAAFSGGASGVTELLGRWALPLLGLFVLVALALVAVDRERLPGRALRLLKVEGRGPLVPVAVPGVHAVYWASWCLHGYLVTLAVGADSAGAWGGSGLFALAPVAGFLALAAPGGIGVREAVIAIGLAPIIGSAGALSAAIASRAFSLGADLAAWGMVRGFVRGAGGEGTA